MGKATDMVEMVDTLVLEAKGLKTVQVQILLSVILLLVIVASFV